MNHRNETFGSGFSESGSAGFAATYCFLKKELREKSNRGRQFLGHKKEVRGANCTLTGRAFTSGAVSITKKEERKKRELVGLKGII
jgi:hypothetical protein